MQRYTKEEVDAAKKFLDFYINLVESNSSTAKFYLAENVVLDWFGKTIKDSKKVSLFIKDQVCKVTHHMTSSTPSQNIAFKECHQVSVPNNEKNLLVIQNPLNKDLTPPKKVQASTSSVEMGQGDGLHNCPMISPPKKMKLSSEDETRETLETEDEPPVSTGLKYVSAEGAVEFSKPSIKKLQTETRWQRPVKLHLGYTVNNFQDCTIYLIIYEGNLKCRRNLYQEFCEADSNTKSTV